MKPQIIQQYDAPHPFEPLMPAQFKAMTGLGERVATATLSALLARGFLATDSPCESLRFGIPRHALRFYFPALWPEAEQDQDLLDGEVGLAAVLRGTARRSPLV